MIKPSDRYPQVDTLPQAIPVFPLSGVLLLPRATLPLNIFEPRYLQLFDDIIAGARVVGIVQPSREAKLDGESPAGTTVPLRSVGCAGRLTAYQELDDGRLIVQLSGICRFSINSEHNTPRLYRTCSVDYGRFARDLEAGHGGGDVDRDALLVALKRFLDARDMKADWASIERAETEQLVNSLAVMSPYGPEEKQALLEAEDLKKRANLLIALAEMELAAGQGSSGPGTMLQ